MKKQPLVSVVMPTYNRGKTLPRAIGSVLKQTYNNWELIIVDDKNTDNTKEVIDRYGKKDKRIKYVLNERNKGISGARNSGLDVAKGDYVAFLDDDDEWFKNHLKESIKILENEDISVCQSIWCDRINGKIIQYRKDWIKRLVKDLNPKVKGKFYFFGPDYCEYAIMVPFYCNHICTLVINKKILEEKRFNENLYALEDIEFVFRLIAENGFCLINNNHLIYNRDSGMTSFTGKKATNKNIFHKKNYIKSFKYIKKIIRESNNIKNKKECFRRINKYITSLCFKVGCLLWKNKKIDSLKYFFKSFFYYILSLYYCPREIAFVFYLSDKDIRSKFWYINTKEDFRKLLYKKN